MGKPYLDELLKVPETFTWAATTKNAGISGFIRATSHLPALGIGSGGSLSAAFALKTLHWHYTRQLALTATPLAAHDYPFATDAAIWLFSAGGQNVDIVSAAKALVEREPTRLAVLCSQPSSRLARLCSEHPHIDFFLHPLPTRKDGFLATNSLLAHTVLIARAYVTEFRDEDTWRELKATCQPYLCSDSNEVITWENDTHGLWQRDTTLLLHGATSQVVAVDLESKFTEAAIGQLQSSDYRNFAHGRHNWLAQRGEQSSVLAIVTDQDEALADKTLALIPDSPIPTYLSHRMTSRAPGRRSCAITREKKRWSGRLMRFRDSLNNAEQALDRGRVVEDSWELCIHHYLASSAATRSINERQTEAQPALSSDTWAKQVHVTFGTLLPETLPLFHPTDSPFIELTNKYYNPVLRTRHTDVGGVKHLGPGYGGCALPLVLDHNTPNNSVALLWAETEGGQSDGHHIATMRPLFRRRQRHA